MTDVEIVPLVQSTGMADINAVVDVHLRSFPGFFLTVLGPRFLGQLYRGIVEDRAGILYIAKDGNRLQGFAAGTLEPAGFYSRLIRDRLVGFALASIGPLLRNPGIFLRLWRAFRKPTESRTLPEKTALLMSIAVDPAVQHRGLGKTLVEVFCEACAKQGAQRVLLTTDNDGNDNVNRFYARLNFVLVRNFITPEGRAMNEYVRVLSSKSGTALV